MFTKQTMTQLLTLTSSLNSEASISTALVERFADGLRQKHGDFTHTQRDLGVNPPPHLDQATIGAFYTPSDALTPEQTDIIGLSDELVEELEAADIIVIGAPMHNFGLASGLKAWVDHVLRVGRTFRYTENGPEGHLKGKQVYVVTARGGDYAKSSPIHALDHQAPYLKTVLAFIGLDDVTFIHAQGVAKGEEGIRAAKAQIDAITRGEPNEQAA